jgi:beta-fructofuranosidase
VNTQIDHSLASTAANPHIAKAMQSVQAAAARAQADPLRPIYHFLPPAYWMNDPNGPIYYGGWYHLFYQHNPFGDEWGYMHWGHARSRDLVHWEHLPIALAPAYEDGEEHVFSGCARVNAQGQLLLVYTSVKQGAREDRADNEQLAAYPLDAELVHWARHAANPVLALATHGGPSFHRDWRDPFIFTAGGRHFLVLGGATDEKLEVALYEAVDDTLTRWRYCGPLVEEPAPAAQGEARRFLECPNFVEVAGTAAGSETKWILLTSPYNLVEYTTGTFDLGTLTFTPEQHGILDAGRNSAAVLGQAAASAPVLDDVPNFYATNLLDDAAGHCVLLGWVRGFEKGRGWNGALALPRLLTIDSDGKPRQQPLPALQMLRGEGHSLGACDVSSGSMVVPGVGGDALEVQLSLNLGRAAAAGLRVRSSGDGQRGVEIRWDGATLTVGGCNAELPAGASRDLTLDVFLDKCILEVFANGGRVVMTRLIYPPGEDLAVEIFAEQGTAYVQGIEVWHMKSIW